MSDPYSLQVLSDTPLAYWRLGELAGTSAVDSGSNSHNGTYTGGVSLGQAGAIACSNNPAALFDGSTGYVDCGLGSTHLSAITVEAWIRPSALAGDHDIITKGYDGANQEFFLRLNAGFLVFQTYDGSAKGVSAVYPGAINEWHHVAGTYSGGTWKVYYDGSELGSASAIAPMSTATRLAIGATYVDGVGLAATFSGLINEVAICPAVLSPGRIKAHCKAGITAARFLPVVSAAA